MLLVNYGEPCRLILGTVSFLQYMFLCTHPPLQGPVFTGVVVRTAWLHVITEFRYSFTPSPLHKHWRQCLSKSISLWQRCSSLRTLEYAEACPLWSSRCFKNLICCFVKLTFPFTFRKSSAFITACHWASALKKCTLNGIVHLKLQFCHHLFILMLCQNCIHLYLLSKIRYFVSISFFFHKKKNPKDLWVPQKDQSHIDLERHEGE